MTDERRDFDPHLDPSRLHAARALTRRHFFGRVGSGVGIAAIASMLGETPANAMSRVLRGELPEGGVGPTPLSPRSPHFAPRAKRVIYLHMAGSPPQQDLWDPKPELQRLDGQPCPQELLDRERFAFIKGHPKMLGSPYAFSQHGGSARG
jgi:hypothetical protein